MTKVLTDCLTAGSSNVNLLAPGYVWISADSAGLARSHAEGIASGLTPAQSGELLDGMLNFFSSPEGTAGFGRFEADWATHDRDECVK
jgi:hypothetical protein